MHPEAEAPVPATTPSAPNLATARRSKQRFGVLSSAALIRNILNKVAKCRRPRWWFRISCIFTPTYREDSHSDEHFSTRLKPPTKNNPYWFMWTLRVGLPYMVRELGLIGLWKLVNGYASKNMLNPPQNMDLAITKPHQFFVCGPFKKTVYTTADRRATARTTNFVEPCSMQIK